MMLEFLANTHLQDFTNAKLLEQICYKWLMAMTDSNSECAKNRRLSGRANGPQWISNKNKQTKKSWECGCGIALQE